MPPDVDLSLFREGEDAVGLDVASPLIIRDDPEAHGCKYIDMGDCIERASMARFDFAVSVAGDYQIYVRSRARDSNSDSFYMKMDYQPVDGFQYVLSSWGSFIEERVMKTDDGGARLEISFPLSQGGHVVELLCREKGAALDWMALVPATTP